VVEDGRLLHWRTSELCEGADLNIREPGRHLEGRVAGMSNPTGDIQCHFLSPLST
jgi:hypothetical protein